MTTASTPTRRRVRARVGGVVQGVGFRPYVFRLAREHGLDGWVGNDARGVVLEVEGEPARVEAFLARLPAAAPPLATVERVVPKEMAPTLEAGFAIAPSPAAGGPADALVSADVAPCAECLAELADPGDRRYRYPFVNCTNCGPRFTIVRGVPYDRARTTMAGFPLCAACRAEYEDPADRRFHAEPIACPACGPRLTLLGADGKAPALDSVGARTRSLFPSYTGGNRARVLGHAANAPAAAGGDPAHPAAAGDPLRAAAAALAVGLIVAVKGLGGYHLACAADDEAAVAALRARKHREEKPFALMAADLEGARALVELTPAEAALLEGRERPIVIARRRPRAAVAASVAPGSPDLGVMLPSTPLHHLLLAEADGPLVMTSGNVSDEPIAHEDADALARLRGIADVFLVHDRPIQTRTDDSVVRAVSPVVSARPLLLRRSRGYVPESLPLPAPVPPLVAYGAELKSTCCVARGLRAWLGPHAGDLKGYETLLSHREGIVHMERLFGVRPQLVVHDLHPDYASTRDALERDGVEHLGVQHHHAHLAACLAEHGQAGPAVGAIYDGTGHGLDGTAWGGELLVGDLGGFVRAGHLRAVRMPGGDRAAREPWRMACAWLGEALGPGAAPPPVLARLVEGDPWEAVGRLARTELAPVTTSVGRLFDAVAALCGLRARTTFEGQAAMELEGACDPAERGTYPIAVTAGDAAPGSAEDRASRSAGDGAPRSAEGGVAPRAARPSDPIVLDPREAVAAAAADAANGIGPPIIAARFHRGLARATAAACALAASRAGTETLVLSGGVFQNRVLLEGTVTALGREGLRVLVPERVPANDGGIAYGQAAVAAVRRGGQK